MKSILLACILIGWGMIMLMLGVYIKKASLEEKTKVKYHPEIISNLDVFTIPLTDSISDICWNPKCVKIAHERNIVIMSQCPLDSSRMHMNISVKKE